MVAEWEMCETRAVVANRVSLQSPLSHHCILILNSLFRFQNRIKAKSEVISLYIIYYQLYTYTVYTHCLQILGGGAVCWAPPPPPPPTKKLGGRVTQSPQWLRPWKLMPCIKYILRPAPLLMSGILPKTTLVSP